ncbi:MAG: hypothetical protein LC650_03310 [Actinobacteria bacterium]|nr:hypothetical protein [Actinomycetota bacterium]
MNKSKIFVALAIAFVIAIVGFTVFKPEPAGQVVFTEPQQTINQDRCVPTGVGVYDTVNLTINEVLQPECK